jgi:hypothetical protein
MILILDLDLISILGNPFGCIADSILSSIYQFVNGPLITYIFFD